ncbi:MAG: hypothetical protein N3A01_09730 [Bacteroidales bacterium]|nr:hypothetical protein [Bacteroidales bacterium]
MKDVLLISFKYSITTGWKLLRIYFPLAILSTILKQIGFFEWLSPYIAPVMENFGLPGKASITLISAYIGNMYAAIATIPALDLTPREVTILGIMTGLCHNLILETGILINLKFATIRIAIFRLFLSITAGLLANAILPAYVNGQVLNPFLQSSDKVNWVNTISGILTTALQIITIIFTLQLIYELLKKTPFKEKLKQILSFIGKIFGISKGGIVPLLVGLFFGIVYGSGIMLQFRKNNSITDKDSALIAVFLILAHAIIEDTMLFVIVGGNFWIIFILRVFVAYAFIRTFSLGNLYRKLYLVGSVRVK